jgi:hypothetical protein
MKYVYNFGGGYDKVSIAHMQDYLLYTQITPID